MRSSALAACAFLLASCQASPPPERSRPPRRDAPSPERSESRAERELAEIRSLLVDVAGAQTCDRLRGRMMTLGGEPGQPFVGRIWLRECESRIEGRRLALDIGAWAWTWVDESSRAAGATFEVEQYVFLEAATTLHVSPEIDYDREDHWAYLWMRPVVDPEVRARSIAHVDADPEGVWSHILGGVVRVFGDSPDERARSQVDEEGDRRFEEEVDEGFSVYTDLCTAEVGLEMGRLRAPPHPRVWPGQASQPTPVRVYPGGIDVHGPISDGGAQMIVAMRARGAPARARLVCEDETETLIRAFRRTGGRARLPEVRTVADATIAAGEREVLRGGNGRACPLFIVTASASDRPTTVAFTVRPVEDDRRPLVPGCRSPMHARR